MSSILKPVLGSQLQYGHRLATGLVGLWLLNEGSGNKVFDLSGNGINGALQGNTVWTPGKFGSALDFDGTSGGVDCGVGFNTSGWTEMTVVVWAKTNLNNTILNRAWIRFGNSASDRVFYFYWGSNENIIFLVVNTDDTTFSTFDTDGLENDLDWHQYIGVLKSPNIDIYKDLVVGDNPATNFTGTLQTFGGGADGLWLGAGSASGASVWPGQIGHVSIYNRALSASERAELYEKGPSVLVERDPIELWVGATSVGAPPAGIVVLRRRRESA